MNQISVITLKVSLRNNALTVVEIWLKSIINGREFVFYPVQDGIKNLDAITLRVSDVDNISRHRKIVNT